MWKLVHVQNKIAQTLTLACILVSKGKVVLRGYLLRSVCSLIKLLKIFVFAANSCSSAMSIIKQEVEIRSSGAAMAEWLRRWT